MNEWLAALMFVYLFCGVWYVYWLCKRTEKFAGALLHDHERRLRAIEQKSKSGSLT